MAYRVIQWSTGNVGRYALRGIIGHPDLELAGLWVHSTDKAGCDAGELCGLAPTGVLATNDAEPLLALDADCVCYTATADVRPFEALDDLKRILSSGKNVVSSSLVQLVYPQGGPPELAEPLEAACLTGGASCFFSGIDPGFANDVLPLLLSGVCERIEGVRVQEVLNYATYDQPQVLFETMGFAKPLDHMPILLAPGVLTLAWGSVVRVIADGLGIELDEIVEWHEKRPAPETFTVPSGVVDKDTMAGLRFELRGMAGGKERVVIEHVTRLRDDIAPEWPAPPGKGGYRVLIEGSPSITCEFTLEGDDGDENSGGLIVTAMRLVNAIPAVCEAKPGLLSALDLPLVTGRNLVH
ncbi:MAG: diacylglycerol kinase [Actinomycetota bacterium]|nr:diacylglycerol kinase [Actinomycetota bacterium]